MKDSNKNKKSDDKTNKALTIGKILNLYEKKKREVEILKLESNADKVKIAARITNDKRNVIVRLNRTCFFFRYGNSM
jgi:hypothetical protein